MDSLHCRARRRCFSIETAESLWTSWISNEILKETKNIIISMSSHITRWHFRIHSIQVTWVMIFLVTEVDDLVSWSPLRMSFAYAVETYVSYWCNFQCPRILCLVMNNVLVKKRFLRKWGKNCTFPIRSDYHKEAQTTLKCDKLSSSLSIHF